MHYTDTIGILGLGVVGKALCAQCVHLQRTVCVYDISSAVIADVVEMHNVSSQPSVHALAMACSVLLVALPTVPIQPPPTTHTPPTIPQATYTTQASPQHTPYDLSAFHNVLDTVAKLPTPQQPLLFFYSTFIPHTLNHFKTQYPHLHMFHVPEFLSSATAVLDTLHPTQPTVLLGAPDTTPASVVDRARRVLGGLVSPSQRVVVVKSAESEATKLFCNAFYATKVQLCNEFYALCQQHHISYDMVRHLMLQQGWIHPMHTQVPGPNGERGFGGACLPKDLTALCTWSEQHATTHQPTEAQCEVLQAVRREHGAQNKSTTHDDTVM